MLARQSKRIDSDFFEGPDGLLRRRHPREPDIEQVVLPETLRPRVLQLAHHAKLAGHPGQTSMYYNVRRTNYWPHMAADIFATVRNCTTCAKNRLKLGKRTNPLKLFPATKPLASLCIDILGTLSKSKRGYVFLLVIIDRFKKLTRVVPLRKITAYNVAVAFVEHWVFRMDPRSASSRITERGSLLSSSKQCASCLEYRMSLHRHTTPRRMGRWSATTGRSWPCCAITLTNTRTTGTSSHPC